MSQGWWSFPTTLATATACCQWIISTINIVSASIHLPTDRRTSRKSTHGAPITILSLVYQRIPYRAPSNVDMPVWSHPVHQPGSQQGTHKCLTLFMRGDCFNKLVSTSGTSKTILINCNLSIWSQASMKPCSSNVMQIHPLQYRSQFSFTDDSGRCI